MPFKIEGGYYFEAVKFVNDANRDLHENRLALCPTCAAKYRHARGTSFFDLREDLLTQEVGAQGSTTVDVVLAGEPAMVRLVGKHAIDLQSVFEATDGPRIQDDGHADYEIDDNGLLAPASQPDEWSEAPISGHGHAKDLDAIRSGHGKQFHPGDLAR